MNWHFDALGVQCSGSDAGLTLSVAVTCLRGTAARWFQILCATGSTPSDFEDLCQQLKRQCGVIDEQRKARDALLTLRQTHSVGDYIQKFESIAVCITDIQESESLHKFIHGLKFDIKSRVLVANPSDINEAMQFAQSLDDVLHPRNPYMRRPQYSSRINYNRRDGVVPMDLDAIQEQPSHQKNGWKRGNCRKCGKPGHWAVECKSQTAQAAYTGPRKRGQHFHKNQGPRKFKHTLRQAEDSPDESHPSKNLEEGSSSTLPQEPDSLRKLTLALKQ